MTERRRTSAQGSRRSRPEPEAPRPAADELAPKIALALGKLGLAQKQAAWRDAGRRGLSPTQAQILALLGRAGPLRTSALAERLALKMPTVSESVGALASKGLVTREPDPDDARARLIALTADGARAADAHEGWPDLFATAVHVMSEAEQSALYSGVYKTLRVLQERGDIPPSRMCVSCTFFRPHVRSDPDRPHRCELLGVDFGPSDLRIDCDEHQLADPAVEAAQSARFFGRPTR